MSQFLMPEPAIGRESYMHRAAKEVLVRWLRDSETEMGWHLAPLSARPNRGMPTLGILMEYPIALDGAGVCPVWDEIGWPGLPDDWDGWDGMAPSAGQLIAAGVKLGCVCDVALWHKGWCHAVIEVVNKHPTPTWKLDFLRRVGVQDVYEIDADWIMRQSAKPAELAVRQIA